MDFYLDLHKQFKGDEPMQTAILKFIVECLVLSGIDERYANSNNDPLLQVNSSQIVMSLNDFPRVKDLLINTI